MTLLDQAKKEFIIISPYNNITYWRKLLTRIKKAQERRQFSASKSPNLVAAACYGFDITVSFIYLYHDDPTGYHKDAKKQ